MPIRNKFIVIGCGRLGSSLANKASMEGESVIVFDNREISFERLDDSFGGFTVLGDATDRRVLSEQYLKQCKTMIVTTGNDNVNLFVATIASKIYEIPRVYVRFTDPDFSILVSGLDVQAIYPAELSFRRLEDIMKEDDR